MFEPGPAEYTAMACEEAGLSLTVGKLHLYKWLACVKRQDLFPYKVLSTVYCLLSSTLRDPVRALAIYLLRCHALILDA